VELFDVMRTTFAARAFTDDPVDDATLHEIFENARFAPSGGNRQGWRVIVVRDPETKRRLGDLCIPAAKRYVAQIQAGESPWNSVVATKVSPETIEGTVPPDYLSEPARRAPVVLVFAVDLKVVASIDQNLDRVGVISGASIYPFVWNVLMGARQAGLGGTITTLATAQEPALKALLGIPADHAVCAVVPLGRPLKQLSRLKRNAVDSFATRERFDGEPVRSKG
jgi:nitroreductase